MALSATNMVLQHLIKRGSITTYDAFTLYGATRLSAIIYNLRHGSGYNIISHREPVTTRNGAKTTIARYVLEPKEGDNIEL